MKKKRLGKLLASVMALVVCCTVLTGCIGMVGNIKINADGSGSVVMRAGFSEEAMKIIDSMGESQFEEGERQEFMYNGVKYIGSVASLDFSVPEEFNYFMTENSEEEDTGVNTGLFHLSKGVDGLLSLTLTADETTGDTSAVEEQMASEEAGLSQEVIDALLDEMALVYTFEFPCDVTQTVGETTGVEIVGNKITIDFIKLGEALNGRSDVLTFKSAVASAIEKLGFNDVNVSDWFHMAVSAMADGGLVQGVGDNRFAPLDTLTYAQFCQILARAEGLEVGEENGYWAYKAIEACRDKGYIIDLGSYTPANYDVPMPREAAVAGMFRAKATELFTSGKVGTSISDSDIPDYNSIDYNYRSDIVDAYNSGITNGIDSLRTFNPKGILTRAEVCQLFYNLDWTTIAK